jgi:hypothetical protein
MAAQKKKPAVSAPIGIHELQLALLREEIAAKDWDLRTAARELDVIKRVLKKVDWPKDYLPLVEVAASTAKHLAKVVDNKDTTRLTAAHTELEDSIFALRDKLYR